MQKFKFLTHAGNIENSVQDVYMADVYKKYTRSNLLDAEISSLYSQTIQQIKRLRDRGIDRHDTKN